MVPLQPREALAVRGEGGGGDEVRPGDDDLPAVRIRAGDIELDEGVDRLDAFERVVLADGDDPVVVRVDHEVGEAPRAFRGDRFRIGAFTDAVEAVVGPVRDDDDAVPRRPAATAVLVHAGADVEGVRGQLGRLARFVADQGTAAALVGPPFEPVDRLPVGAGLAQPGGAGDEHVDGDGRGPRAVWGDGRGREVARIGHVRCPFGTWRRCWMRRCNSASKYAAKS